MKKDFIMPILVVSLICVFVTGALAIGHSLTQPVITAAAAERAAVAMRAIVPHADYFEPLELDGLPTAVNSAYRISGNEGYIFIVTSMGFGGDMRVISGIGADGMIIRTAVLSHTETLSFAAPVFAQAHAGQYWGQDRNGIEGISAVSGSTITSVAFRNAVRYAFDAFDAITAGGTQ
ncbi:MAG: FMN-binding protein [Treponema sp.]|nr:FMN-binding protein [Treponema sp.]